jgi:hypothetical protein
MNHMAHHVEGGILPWDQVAVVPDFGSCLNRHGGLKNSFGRAGHRYISGYRESRQHVTAAFGLPRLKESLIRQYRA